MIKHYLFLRDDDVYRLNKSFLDFFNLFLKAKLPVIYAVIPGKASGKLLNFLRKQKIDNPKLLDIVQHGWKHCNLAASENDKYEFGDNVSYARQEKDIVAGLSALHAKLGDAFTPTFVPPYHGYNQNTIDILSKLGFIFFSAGSSMRIHPENLISIPARISLTAYGKNKKTLTYDEFKPVFLSHLRHPGPQAILFHHKEHNKKNWDELKKIVAALIIARKSGKIRFALFSDILRAKKTKFPNLSLTLEITNRCNLKCHYCSIWNEKTKNDLPPDKLLTLFDSLNKKFNLSFISLTGGEPFLHPQFDRIYKALVAMRNKRRLSKIGIYSNGYDTNRIIDFLNRNKNSVDGLILGISVDGIGRTHSYLRGRNYAYKNAIASINMINSLFPRIKLQIKSTISPVNYKQLKQLYLFCKKRGFIFEPKFAESRAYFYYNRVKNNSKASTQFTFRQKRELLKTLRWIFITEEKNNTGIVDLKIIKAMANLLSNAYTKPKRCLNPSSNLFITSSGDIHPCLYKEPITNISSNTQRTEIFGKRHIRIINEALLGDCPGCKAYHGYLKDINL